MKKSAIAIVLIVAGAGFLSYLYVYKFGKDKPAATDMEKP